MRYLSPIRLYLHCDIELDRSTAFGKDSLKALVSERLSVIEDENFIMEDVTYNKVQVLESFDNPKWEEEFDYHLLIWNHPLLCDFLENDRVEISQARKEWSKLGGNEGFVDFVSPYFSTSFDQVMKIFLNPANFDEAIYWLSFIRFVREKDMEQATVSIESFLDESIELFRKVNSISYNEYSQQLIPWTETSWYLFINNLPEGLYQYKEILVQALMSLTVELQQTQLEVAYMISVRLTQLRDLSFGQNDLIEKNHERLSKEYSGPIGELDVSERGGSSKWNIFWIILVTVKLILLAIKCAQ